MTRPAGVIHRLGRPQNPADKQKKRRPSSELCENEPRRTLSLVTCHVTCHAKTRTIRLGRRHPNARSDPWVFGPISDILRYRSSCRRSESVLSHFGLSWPTRGKQVMCRTAKSVSPVKRGPSDEPRRRGDRSQYLPAWKRSRVRQRPCRLAPKRGTAHRHPRRVA